MIYYSDTYHQEVLTSPRLVAESDDWFMMHNLEYKAKLKFEKSTVYLIWLLGPIRS